MRPEQFPNSCYWPSKEVIRLQPTIIISDFKEKESEYTVTISGRSDKLFLKIYNNRYELFHEGPNVSLTVNKADKAIEIMLGSDASPHVERRQLAGQLYFATEYKDYLKAIFNAIPKTYKNGKDLKVCYSNGKLPSLEPKMKPKNGQNCSTTKFGFNAELPVRKNGYHKPTASYQFSFDRFHCDKDGEYLYFNLDVSQGASKKKYKYTVDLNSNYFSVWVYNEDGARVDNDEQFTIAFKKSNVSDFFTFRLLKPADYQLFIPEIELYAVLDNDGKACLYLSKGEAGVKLMRPNNLLHPKGGLQKISRDTEEALYDDEPYSADLIEAFYQWNKLKCNQLYSQYRAKKGGFRASYQIGFFSDDSVSSILNRIGIRALENNRGVSKQLIEEIKTDASIAEGLTMS